MSHKVAITTGGNRGIGFAIVKALCEKFDGTVYLTARDVKRGEEAVIKLNKIGLKPKFHQLDITDEESIKKLAVDIKEDEGGIDVLINNAAILEWDDIYPTYEVAKRTIDVNYKSLIHIEEHLYPLLRNGAKVVNVCSAAGHLSNLRNKKWIEDLKDKSLTVDKINNFINEYLDSVKNGTFNKDDFADNGKHAEFRVAKVAVAALTMIQARKYKSRHIAVNLIHPGHVKTDMANGGGEIDAEDAAKHVLYLIFDASPNMTGVFMWHDKKLVDWYNENGDYYLQGLW